MKRRAAHRIKERITGSTPKGALWNPDIALI